MKLTARLILIVLALVAWGIIAIATIAPAHAQTAPPGTTPNSICGAMATGLSPRTNQPVTGAFEFQSVNAVGVWTYGCKMPKPCAAGTKVTVWRGADGTVCRGAPSTLRSGVVGETQSVIGINQAKPSDWAGAKTFACTPAGWREVPALTRCDGH